MSIVKGSIVRARAGRDKDKFFVDKGILLANAFPVLCHVLIYYFAFHLRNVSKEFNFIKIVSLMKKGIEIFKNS